MHNINNIYNKKITYYEDQHLHNALKTKVHIDKLFWLVGGGLLLFSIYRYQIYFNLLYHALLVLTIVISLFTKDLVRLFFSKYSVETVAREVAPQKPLSICNNYIIVLARDRWRLMFVQ